MEQEKASLLARLLRPPNLMEEMCTIKNPLRDLTNQIQCFLTVAAHVDPVVMEPTASSGAHDLPFFNAKDSSCAGETVELNVVAGVLEAIPQNQLRHDIILPTERSAEMLSEERRQEAESLVQLWNSLTPCTTEPSFSCSRTASSYPATSENIEMGCMKTCLDEGRTLIKHTQRSGAEEHAYHTSNKASWNSKKAIDEGNDRGINDECVEEKDSCGEDSEEVEIMIAGDACSSSSGSFCSDMEPPLKKTRVVELN